MTVQDSRAFIASPYSYNADRSALTAYQDASPGDAVQLIELDQAITIRPVAIIS